jgi:ATP synthase protein I
MTTRNGRDDAETGSSSDADLARRLDRLSHAIAAERREQAAAAEPPPSGRTGYALGFRMASEFVAGTLVGAALGWGLDRLAGTSPWGLIGFLLLGFVAGVMNVLRVAGQMSTGAARGDDDGGR